MLQAAVAVRTVPNLDPADLDRAERDYVPMIALSAAAEWPALTAWQGITGLQRLAALAGGAQVQVCLKFVSRWR
jgi:hypothetical protein